MLPHKPCILIAAEMCFPAAELWRQPFAANHFFRIADKDKDCEGHTIVFSIFVCLNDTSLCMTMHSSPRIAPRSGWIKHIRGTKGIFSMFHAVVLLYLSLSLISLQHPTLQPAGYTKIKHLALAPLCRLCWTTMTISIQWDIMLGGSWFVLCFSAHLCI